VKWRNSVHQCQRPEHNIGYVEYGKEPFVAVRIEVEVVLHARDSGISTLTSAIECVIREGCEPLPDV